MKKERKMTVNAPMYVYATEMVASYYRRLKLKGKRVLTVAGSGDQVLNALFYGAKEITGFDINRNALFMTELKIAAITAFSYSEFLRFFSQAKTGFDHRLYLKMGPFLSIACQQYFDRLYSIVGPKGLGASEYFRSRSELIPKSKVLEINGYLASPSAYRKMRRILHLTRPTLYVENVLTLSQSKKLHGKKFDLINLSNVPNYLTGQSFGLSENDVLSYFCKLKKLVSKSGDISFYSYDDATYPNPVSTDIPPVSRASFLKKIKQLGLFDVSRKSFPGLHDGSHDRITLLGC